MKLSIIIPVFNEEEHIEKLIQSLHHLNLHHQVLVVDGGSDDKTCAILRNNSIDYIQSQKGRAKQMNAGAKLAEGDTLLFLHADTLLPEDISEIFNLGSTHSLWGRFDLKLSGKQFFFRIIEFMINLRSRFTGIATGDQAIFVSKELFEKINGYEEIPLMEDVALCKALRKIAKPVCLKSTAITSSRRWEENGVIKTIFLMWSLRFLYFLGISPKNLKQFYA